MKCLETDLPGVKLLEPSVHGDERGFFFEAWNRRRFEEFGIHQDFVQLNFSRSTRGVLRGLHYQYPHPQAKLVTVLEGSVFDVAVDLRPDSPSYANWYGCELSEANRRQLLVPEGFAHGFMAISETVLFGYLVSDFYKPEHDRAVSWNDPDIGIEWPTSELSDDIQLSDRDRQAPRLEEVRKGHLPQFR